MIVLHVLNRTFFLCGLQPKWFYRLVECDYVIVSGFYATLCHVFPMYVCMYVCVC